MSRGMWYLVANLAFAMLVAVGSPAASTSGVHPLYLLALFPLCSTPILHLGSFNDRHALPGLFFAMYFMFFGVIDLDHLLMAVPGPHDSAWLSDSELLILAGGACAYAGCLLAGRIWRSAPPADRDWPEATAIAIGTLLWLVTTVLTWRFKLYVVSDTIIENQQASLAQAGALMAAIYVLAAYLQPLGILILAYAETRYRRGWLSVLVVAAVLVQAALGFAEDSKGEIVLGLVLVVVTKTLVSGRLPRRWLLFSLLFLGLAWPVMQANRAVRDEHSLTRADVAGRMWQTLQWAIQAKTMVTTGPDRSQTFSERASLKGSVEMIVQGTDHGVPFQHGYTLSPIALAFIPRLLWPGKPDVQTGLLVNKAFQVVPDALDTYISPSYLGELYWNFGWPGALAGMALLGLLLGYLGARFDLSSAATLTRVMVVVVSIRQLVWGFESSVGAEYVVWLRSLVAIGLLYLVLARRTGAAAEQEEEPAEPVGGGPAPALFPNLMR